jgi:hypothetical protein
MAGARPEVPVEGAGRRVADLDDALVAVLAADGDLPLPQVQIATLRIHRVVADPGELGQPDAGRLEHRDDRCIPPLQERTALASPLQFRKFNTGEHRDELLGDPRRPQPRHRVGQLLFPAA